MKIHLLNFCKPLKENKKAEFAFFFYSDKEIKTRGNFISCGKINSSNCM